MGTTETVPGSESLYPPRPPVPRIPELPSSEKPPLPEPAEEGKPASQREADDEWWLKHVYQGEDVPQLTLRSVFIGVLLGGIFSLSNLYLGFKMGFGIGAGITAAILAFAIFKTLGKVFPRYFSREFTLLENNTMQSTATAAGSIPAAGLISAIPALMMLTGQTLSWWKLSLWMASICFLGLFVAIPMKRQMINCEKLKFPTGTAAAETMKSMHLKGGDAMKKAKALGAAGVLGAAVAWLREGTVKWMPFNIPQTWGPAFSISGISASRLTLSFEGGLIMVAGGAIMGLRIGLSILIGALLNYAVLAPILIQKGAIKHSPPAVTATEEIRFPLLVQAGAVLAVNVAEQGSPEQSLSFVWGKDAAYENMEGLVSSLNDSKLPGGRTNPMAGILEFFPAGKVLSVRAPRAVRGDATLSIAAGAGAGIDAAGVLKFKPGQAKTVACGGFRNILAWSMWPGTALMVSCGLLAFALRWRTVAKAFGGFKRLFRKKEAVRRDDPMSRVEIPLSWFLKGFCLSGLACVILQIFLFKIALWLALLAIPLSLVLAVVACRAMGETDMNPIGSLGKITQLSYGVISPQNISSNLMAANITAGAATSSADLLTDLKSGYILGGSPRKQFIAQAIGIAAGALLCGGVFLLLVQDLSILGTETLPAPAAQTWAGVARLLSKGFSSLPPYAPLGLLVGALVGSVIAVLEFKSPKMKKFLPSSVAMGIGFVVPAFMSISIFIGAFLGWLFGKACRELGERYTLPAASGAIAGESLLGIFVTMLRAVRVL